MNIRNANRVETIFFDLDHTLWDFEKNSYLTFKSIFREYNFPFSLEEFLRFYIPINHIYWKSYSQDKISKKKLKTIRLIKTFQSLKYDFKLDLINEITDEYIRRLPLKKKLFAGALDLIKFLHSKYKLYIVTNGFEEVQLKKIKNSGLYPYFETIITSEMVGKKKPHPKIFRFALSLAIQKPEQCLMIGDNTKADILGALRVNIRAIHFNSNKEPNHSFCPIVYNHKELYEMFNSK